MEIVSNINNRINELCSRRERGILVKGQSYVTVYTPLLLSPFREADPQFDRFEFGFDDLNNGYASNNK